MWPGRALGCWGLRRFHALKLRTCPPEAVPQRACCQPATILITQRVCLCRRVGSRSVRPSRAFITGSDLAVPSQGTHSLPRQGLPRDRGTVPKHSEVGQTKQSSSAKDGTESRHGGHRVYRPWEGRMHHLHCTRRARRPAEPGWPPAVTGAAGTWPCNGGFGQVLFYEPQCTQWSMNGNSACLDRRAEDSARSHEQSTQHRTLEYYAPSPSGLSTFTIAQSWCTANAMRSQVDPSRAVCFTRCP